MTKRAVNRRAFGWRSGSTALGALIVSGALVAAACGDSKSDGAGSGGSGATAGSGGKAAASGGSGSGGTSGGSSGKGNTAGSAGSMVPGSGGASGNTGGAGGTAGKGSRGGSAGAAGTELQGGEAGVSTGQGGTAAGTGGSGGTGGYAAGCPSARPSETSCSDEGRSCSYGDAPRADCRDLATCTNGNWVITPSTCDPPSPPGDCPANAPMAMASCDTPEQLCRYEDGEECLCLANAALGDMWVCQPPRMPGPNCSALPPNAGSSCTGGTTCTYACGPLSTNALSAHCSDAGVWTWTLTPCSGMGG